MKGVEIVVVLLIRGGERLRVQAWLNKGSLDGDQSAKIDNILRMNDMYLN